MVKQGQIVPSSVHRHAQHLTLRTEQPHTEPSALRWTYNDLLLTPKNLSYGEDQCMPSLFRRLILIVLCLCASPGWGVNPIAADTLLLDGAEPVALLDREIKTWVDEGSQATIGQAVANTLRFKATSALERQPFNRLDTVWIRLRIQRAPGAGALWSLNIPLPSLDAVALYQPDGAGGWSVQQAGDTLAQSRWTKPGLYPDFDVKLPQGQPQDIYLQIRNFKPLTVPIRLVPVAQRDHQRQLELLGMSLMLGALLSLAILSALRFMEHRKAIDGWAAMFGLLVVATIAQMDGILNAFVWGEMPDLGNYASSTMPVAAIGFILLFVREVFVQSVHFRWFDRLLSIVGWSTVASILFFWASSHLLADRISGVFMLTATTLSLIASLLGWRSGSAMARWLFLAMVFQFLGQLYGLADGVSIVPVVWQMHYLASISAALALPVLLYVLSQLTHDRKELVVRASHLPTQDALTGLLTPDVFQVHLEQSVARAIHGREPIALVLVSVTNHAHILKNYGDTIAEQTVLRAVVKLQRILRDVDPAGRVGSAQFALLMEGVSKREAVTERMVKLIASGLIPLPGLVPEVTLHFQAACVMLHDNPVSADRVIADLHDVLAEISPNSRRPIRFLEALPTEASHPNTQFMQN
jgi:GGDEF domain-containing protein